MIAQGCGFHTFAEMINQGRNVLFSSKGLRLWASNINQNAFSWFTHYRRLSKCLMANSFTVILGARLASFHKSGDVRTPLTECSAQFSWHPNGLQTFPHAIFMYSRWYTFGSSLISSNLLSRIPSAIHRRSHNCHSVFSREFDREFVP